MSTPERFLRELESWGHRHWSPALSELWEQRLRADAHGHMPRWREAIQRLPTPGPNIRLDASQRAVRIVGDGLAVDRAELQQLLMTFHPWRKGPFELFGLTIDTEWQSFMKWDRLASTIDFRNRRVLDVGCGNGYYGWRMLDAGASCVVGFDPYPLYNMQFQVVQRYAPESCRHFLLPFTDQELPDPFRLFDCVLSMGVLYHRTSPIDHLQALAATIVAGGQLVLETLVVDSVEETVLVPANRYAKMRNVWFIPSVPMLVRWLERTGFGQIEIVDVSSTTTVEQRRTEWMTFESIDDFLAPNDPASTVEGYPAPRRAIVVGRT